MVRDTRLRKRETKEAQMKKSAKLELVDNVQVGAIERKTRNKSFENGENTVGKKRRRNKEEFFSTATDEDAEKVKVANLPLPVLEKIFSYLDWKELGRAMLVCKSWEEVGGHPSMWTQFPLQLKAFRPHWRRLKEFVKIRRLGWVKSVTLTLDKSQYRSPYPAFEEILKHLTRTEELLFIFSQIVSGRENIQRDFMKMQAANNNRLVRIGAFYPRLRLGSESHFFVTNCDAGTSAFIKRTMAYGRPSDESNILIDGLPGVQLSNEVVETLYKKPISTLATNLIIGQNINLEKFKYFLKHVDTLDWKINVKDCDNQEVAPINAILDLLGSQRWQDQRTFYLLVLPKELLLKSHCLERLGGRAKVEAFITENPHFEIKNSVTGLKMVPTWNSDWGDDESDDEEVIVEDDGEEDNHE